MRRVRTPQQKRAARNKRLYLKKRERFLAVNACCGRCGGPSDQVQHKAGRVGDALLDETRWMAVCAPCHVYITEHPAESYERGWSLRRIGEAS